MKTLIRVRHPRLPPSCGKLRWQMLHTKRNGAPSALPQPRPSCRTFSRIAAAFSSRGRCRNLPARRTICSAASTTMQEARPLAGDGSGAVRSMDRHVLKDVRHASHMENPTAAFIRTSQSFSVPCGNNVDIIGTQFGQKELQLSGARSSQPKKIRVNVKKNNLRAPSRTRVALHETFILYKVHSTLRRIAFGG